MEILQWVQQQSLVNSRSILLTTEDFCVLIFIHLVLTKQPFILRMNPVNPRVRKPVIRLCKVNNN